MMTNYRRKSATRPLRRGTYSLEKRIYSFSKGGLREEEVLDLLGESLVESRSHGGV